MDDEFYLNDEDEWQAFKRKRRIKILICVAIVLAVLIVTFLIMVACSSAPSANKVIPTFNNDYADNTAKTFFPYEE